jgi:hypothetical protein
VWEGGRKSTVLLEGSQDSPTRPCDKSIVKVKTFKLLEIKVWERGRRILIFWISVELHNSKKKNGTFYSKGAQFD